MPDISQQTEVTETQLDTDGTFGVGYTEGGEKKTGKLLWTTLKSLIKKAVKPRVLTTENIGTTYADVGTHTFNNKDVLSLCLYETTGSERGSCSLTVIFEDLHTSHPTTTSVEWSGSGARVQFIKSGQKIQAKREGPITASNTLVITVIGSAA